MQPRVCHVSGITVRVVVLVLVMSEVFKFQGIFFVNFVFVFFVVGNFLEHVKQLWLGDRLKARMRNSFKTDRTAEITHQDKIFVSFVLRS